eukprot:TRINITY_DN1524_c0_g1_i1.p1 TRINITY_DN1524_c0_g1~~TRINITY_DN1524_c0_g1_i1.p1  ORF type:complete len:337 (-),score=95.05 TRINITY_DN1524_c0_g1_i1:18-1028(-)
MNPVFTRGAAAFRGASKVVRSNSSNRMFAGSKGRSYSNDSNASTTSKIRFASVAAIGAIAAVGVLSFTSWSANAEEKKKQEGVLNPKEFVEFPLSEVIPVNHNTQIFRFKLPKRSDVLGLPVASCIMIRVPGAGENGKDVARPYTPLDSQTTGHFDLLVKKYANGVASSYIHGLKVGEKLGVKGPFTSYPYKANVKKEIGMIAGGTGLTPMLQVAHEILKNPEDKTKVTFVFANIEERDILLKKELDEMAKKHKNFKVYYVLEKPPKDWKQGKGYVSANIIKEQLPQPSDDNLIMVCGPPPMMDAISGRKNPDFTQGEVSGILKDLGYTANQVRKF